MNDTKDLIREIQEHIGLNGIEDTATHLLVQAAAALQRQADELAAIGAGGVSGPLMRAAQAPAVPAGVLTAIRAAGMHLLRGVDDVYLLVPAMGATAQAAPQPEAAPASKRLDRWNHSPLDSAADEQGDKP